MEFTGDDPEMRAAIEEAQQRLPEFWRVVTADARRPARSVTAMIKAQFESLITHQTEHLWIKDVSFEGEEIFGTVDSAPHAIPEVSRGDRVSISPEAISDWIYVQHGKAHGGFTHRVMLRRNGGESGG